MINEIPLLELSDHQLAAIQVVAAQVIACEEATDMQEALEYALSAIINAFLSTNYFELKIFIKRFLTELDGAHAGLVQTFWLADDYLDHIHSITG